MKRKNIHISTGSLEQFGANFIKAWNQGEAGTAAALDAEQVCFMEVSTLLNTLTKKRLEILRTLQVFPGITIYKLAQQLERNYKNVHRDVGLLKDVGLIQVDENGGLVVPFTRIHAEINLAA